MADLPTAKQEHALYPLDFFKWAAEHTPVCRFPGSAWIFLQTGASSVPNAYTALKKVR